MKNLCQGCNKNEIEVYQLDFEGCFDCWMNQTTPKISYRSEIQIPNS
jgi:hypothetical protein